MALLPFEPSVLGQSVPIDSTAYDLAFGYFQWIRMVLLNPLKQVGSLTGQKIPVT